MKIFENARPGGGGGGGGLKAGKKMPFMSEWCMELSQRKGVLAIYFFLQNLSSPFMKIFVAVFFFFDNVN